MKQIPTVITVQYNKILTIIGKRIDFNECGEWLE